MKISLSVSQNAPQAAPFVFKGNWFEEINKAADIGFDAVELHVKNPIELNVNEVIALCKQRNIKVSSIGTGLGYGLDGLSLSSKDPIVREKAIERIKSQIEFAHQLDALVIVGLMKGQIKDAGSYELFDQYLTESLTICLEHAKKHNVIIVFEAINRYESDVLNTMGKTIDFMKKFNSPYLKLHIDLFHMNMEEKSIRGSILEAKDWIAHIHVADNNRQYPGAGCFNFEPFIQALKDIGYIGYLAMECLDLPEPYTAAKEGYQFLKNII